MTKHDKIVFNMIRTALADYIRSEGCSCCENTDEHNRARNLLGDLLHVKKYEDNSGYDFSDYETQET